MEETLDTNSNQTGRPTFLTVLCILTFIGSGLGLIGGLLGLIGTSALGMFAPQGSMIVQILGLIAAALCLFGAIKMWGLYKQGFMMYVLGAGISIVGSIISGMSIGSAVSESMNAISTSNAELDAASAEIAGSMVSSLAWGSIALGIIITIVFVLMYNANRKHLVK